MPESDKFLEMLNDAVRNSIRDLPTPHCQFITEGEQTILVYKTQMGDFEFRYKPSEALDIDARRAGEHFAKMMLDSQIAGKTLKDVASSELKLEDWPQIMAVWFKIFFAHLLGNNAAIAVKSTLREVELVTAAFMQFTMIRPLVLIKGLKHAEVSGLHEYLARVLEESAKEKKEMLEGYLSGLSPVSLERLAGFYDALYPIWCDIQDIAARHEDAWRDMVTAKYKDKTIVFDNTFESLFSDDLADDLLKRISGDVDSLTESEEKIIEAHDGNDTPSSIAIEHAARLCGAWRYQFRARTLYRRLREQRDSEHTNPPTDKTQ